MSFQDVDLFEEDALYEDSEGNIYRMLEATPGAMARFAIGRLRQKGVASGLRPVSTLTKPNRGPVGTMARMKRMGR